MSRRIGQGVIERSWSQQYNSHKFNVLLRGLREYQQLKTVKGKNKSNKIKFGWKGSWISPNKRSQ